MMIRRGSIIPSQNRVQYSTQKIEEIILNVALDDDGEAKGEIYMDAGMIRTVECLRKKMKEIILIIGAVLVKEKERNLFVRRNYHSSLTQYFNLSLFHFIYHYLFYSNLKMMDSIINKGIISWPIYL